jgi:hypothetical protein
MFETFDDARLSIRKWKVLFMVTLLIPILVYSMYAFYTLSFKPPQDTVLLNASGGLYSNEDLSQTTVSEGEVKQFAYDVLVKVFDYHYRSFAFKERYRKMVEGEKEVDLPDHREMISPFFDSNEIDSVIDSLENAPWMENFYLQRRNLSLSFPAPPEKISAKDFYLTADDRLNVDYKGHFYVFSESKGFSRDAYRVNYEITLERKPLVEKRSDKNYFFGPMVKYNTFEWRVKSLDWNSDRRQ